MLVTNEISENIPKTNFVADSVAKVAWALPFCDSLFYWCSLIHGDRNSPLSRGLNLTGICKESLSELWGLDKNAVLELKMSVLTPAITLLDLIPEFENELDASWFIWFWCEGGEISPVQLSTSEDDIEMLLLTGVDPGVLVFWSLCWSVTIANGSESWSDTFWPLNQVSANSKYLGVAIYDDWLMRY